MAAAFAKNEHMGRPEQRGMEGVLPQRLRLLSGHDADVVREASLGAVGAGSDLPRVSAVATSCAGAMR